MDKSEMCEAYEFDIAYEKGYNRGVKDFAKLLIDKSKNGTVSVMDIVDYAKEWCENNG
jgi:hypothetical protein